MRSLARVGFSLVATVVGLITASVVFAAYAWTTWGSLADVDVVLLWAALFGALGWLVFFVPLILVLPHDGRFVRWPTFTIVGIVLGLAAFWLLVGWWAPLWHGSMAYLVHPAVTGGVAGAVYARLVVRGDGLGGRSSG